jgi:hypothetical protein
MPFEQYCTCRQFEDDADDNLNFELPKGDLPF